jgi:enoyl-CoA hydratase/carnithine racemase
MNLERERLSDGVEVLRLDRPQQRNALNLPLLRALVEALQELAADPDLRAVILSSTGTDAFCAGADINEALSAADGVVRMEAFTSLYTAIEGFPAPTICVCVGHCVGAGAELAAGCDLRVVADNAKLAWSGALLGVPVGPARLSPLVGLSRAKELIFTGRPVGSAEAVALGLAARTAPAEEAEATAVELARELARHPPDGLRRLKRMFSDLDGTPARVAEENAMLNRWQRRGPGLPSAPPPGA